MKRDIELVRIILMQIEEAKPLGWLAESGSASFKYHLKLLNDAGFIKLDGTTPHPRSPGSEENSWQHDASLTWKGHDFVDAARNETVWKRFLGMAKDVSFDTGLEILKEIAKEVAKDIIKRGG